MPAMHDAPFRALQYTVAARGPWAERLRGVGSAPPILDAGGYWDLLRPRATTLELWETTYLHVLTGPDPVFTWVSATGARPTLEALGPELRPSFETEYKARLRAAYPDDGHGVVLPFRRVFVVAQVTA